MKLRLAAATWLPLRAFVPPFLIGLFFRLYGLPRQLLLDDEWHSLNFVLDKSFGDVLTTHGLGANCIPQNVINWIFLHTVGWSELSLFLPSVLCGIAGLLLFPWLVSRLAGRTVALLFSYLFALSPCVIFYSRIVRPYPMVLFFGFLAILCLLIWIREGHPRLLSAYALSGFMAIYFHLYAALPVLAPWAALFLLALFRREPDPRAPWLSRAALLRTGILMGLLLVVFLGPAHWTNPWWLNVQGLSHATLSGLREFLSLLSGSFRPLVNGSFAALVAYGLWHWLRKDVPVGLALLSAWAAFGLLLIVATQDGMHAAIQIARYNIVLFPVALLLAASGLEQVFVRLAPARSDRFRLLAGLLLIAGLAAGGPLKRTFSLPNHFMHHSAFQDSYAPIDWSKSRVRLLTPLPQMPRERIPPFYFEVARDPSVPGLIEYPMYIGDPLNFHYYYQHFHRKPVAIGYVPDYPLPPLPTRNEAVFQTTTPDYVFSRAHALGLGGQLRFASLLPLTDSARWRRSHRGWLLVLHRNLLQETLGIRLNSPDAHYLPPALLPYSLNAAFGAPVFSDSQIVAWRIP
jgi:hypothetical protein